MKRHLLPSPTHPVRTLVLFLLLTTLLLPLPLLAAAKTTADAPPVFLPLITGGQSTMESVQAAAAADLFFSEYVEGSSNNKALEIYNGTGATIDLTAGGYNVFMSFNGGTSTFTLNLNGMIAAGDVFVVAQASANAAILAQADQTSTASWFNGDDAVMLRKGTTVVDAIGQIGTDPGTEWGTGLTSTADNTLQRKATICAGDTDGTNAFDPAAEWDGFAQDTVTGLGSHTANCNTPVQPTVINEVLASTTGTDVEYIELYGAPGATLAGLSLIYVEANDAAGAGTIDFRYDFGATDAIGLNGFYLVGTTSGLQSFYGVTPNLAIPTNSLENSSATVALVETATLSGASVSGSEVALDAVGLTDATASTFFFSAPLVGPDGTFFPAGARRVTDGVDTDTAADWVISDFNLGAANTPTAGTTADSAPTVSATSPVAGATSVPVSSDLSVTFSESVDVAAGAIRIECPTGTQVAVNSAATAVTSVTINPASDLPATTNCAIVISAAGVTDNDGPADILVGPTSFSFTTGGGTAITPISAIQGSGATATIGTFTVEAIVVGDYQTQGDGQLRGFFIQEEDADADANPATSEGIFVFCSGCPTAVAVGDQVRVTGTTSEFFTMSQLTASTAGSVSVLTSGNPLPTPATIQLPVPNIPTGDLAAATAAINAYYEPFEGMLVTFPDTLAVSEYFELARYGQVILSEGGRPRTFTDANIPSVAGLINHEIDLASRTLILDDTDNRQNRPVDTPNTAYYHPVPGLSTSNFFRGGDTITNLTGVLHWSFAGQSGTDAWRIRPVTERYSYAFTAVNPRPAPLTLAGTVKVASFNVLNYFLTVDTTSSNDVGNCGPAGTLDCRGADSVQELERQRAKLTQALLGLDAAIVGMIEMENTPNVTPPQQIVADLNALAGVGYYVFFYTGVIGTDAIRVGLLYQPDKVTPVGNFAILDSAVDPRFIDTRNRPALAQTFAENATGARFTVVVNHLKSKGSGCGAGDDDTTTGQGNCNGTRTEAAIALADWLATDPTGSDDPDVLIIGDLNSYAKEDPIVALQNAGYTDLVATFGGANAYSYVFDGQLGYLDHALANASLRPQVADVTEWHINADEIPLFDYNDDVRDLGERDAFEEESDVLPLYTPNAFRTSDHDPVVIGLNLDGAAPLVVVTGVSDGASYTLGSVPTAGCDTQDAQSGVATPATLTVTGGDSNGLGSFTATCSGAADNAGNVADPVSVTYTVTPAGTPVGACGDYTVYQQGATYSAPGWTGAIRVGTNRNNTILGTSGADLILGLGGNDLLTGNGGDDLICGGSGVDLLLGLDGNDHLDGGDGNDVVNGGNGDYDRLIGGAGNDALLDGDGVALAAGGVGNDLLTLALRPGWRAPDGTATFTGLAAGYGNDTVGLVILDTASFLLNITGDEADNPPSPQEGANDKLTLVGAINPASTIIKFEHRLTIRVAAAELIPAADAGADYLTEAVGAESEPSNAVFLPLINH